MKKIASNLLVLIIVLAFVFLCGCDSRSPHSTLSESEKIIDLEIKEESVWEELKASEQPSDATNNHNETEDTFCVEENSDLIESENTETTDEKLTCTLSVRCDTILSNMDLLDSEKTDIVPKDGVIFAEKTVSYHEGDSVFDLLLREMKANKIHMEFVNTPMYDSAYIEGIANIYEYDCGEQSGWVYKVNGQFPNYGCSLYALKAGDKVEWVYSCNSGADVREN